MIKKFLLAISVLLAIAAVIYLSSKSRLAATGFETAISLVYIVVVGGGSIYKVSQWWRYRHDPNRREHSASLSQVYLAKWRKFFFDEHDDEAKKH